MSGSALKGRAVFEGERQAAIRVGRGIIEQAAPELFAEGGDLAVLLFQNPEKVHHRQDRLTVVSAIAHHDESTGGATDVISAALIIADKTDVRRNRVRQKPKASFDVHDRVNYAVTKTDLIIDKDKKQITLNLEIDEKICTMYEYFDIFLGRMTMCSHAARLFGAKFSLNVNGQKVL